MKFLSTAISAGLFLAGCSENKPGQPKDVVEAQFLAQKAATELNLKQVEANIKINDDQAKLRMKVAEACVAAGMVPVFLNGNVDCKHRDGK